ncbi:hypothetical protein L798_08023 [Zootermopsis nevadensis]|uniref:Pre-C2HC domain-containing protein n=1 Tax=Zootermopsis nevadensis TaxID=136037 RepID=A0A067REW5_ZOONE|nr:hypothetical protein L798_08023 [Zootermopsis nevadensis]
MTAWRDKTPLSMYIVELNNVPQSHKISQLCHLCFIKITVEPYKEQTISSRGYKLSGPSGLYPLRGRTLLVVMLKEIPSKLCADLRPVQDRGARLNPQRPNPHTQPQTREFVEIVRNFNPKFSFQCLLNSI